MKVHFKKILKKEKDTGEVWSELWYLYLDNKRSQYNIAAPGYAMYKHWGPDANIDYFLYHDNHAGWKYDNIQDAKIALLEAVARGWTKDWEYFYSR